MTGADAHGKASVITLMGGVRERDLGEASGRQKSLKGLHLIPRREFRESS